MEFKDSQQLKEKRKLLRLSVKEVVEELKKYGITIAVPTLYGYENGHNRPDDKVLAALYAIYGMDNKGANTNLTTAELTHISVDKLKRLRLANDFSSDEVANRIGVSEETYVSIENGASAINGELLTILAVRLGVSVGSLLTSDNGENNAVSTKYGLKHYRVLKRLSKEELGQRAHIPTELVKLYETGDYMPSYNNLCSLAVALEVDINSLFIPRAYWPSFDSTFSGVTLTEQEFQIIYAYRQANSADRRRLEEIANKYPTLVSSEEKRRMPGLDAIYEEIGRLKEEKELAGPGYPWNSNDITIFTELDTLTKEEQEALGDNEAEQQ